MTWRQRLLRLATFSPGVLRKSVCVRPRLPARRFQGCKEQIWQLPPPAPKFLECLQHHTLAVFFPTGGLPLGREMVRTFLCPHGSPTLMWWGGGREGMAGEAIGRVTAWEIGGQPLKV